MNEAGPKDVFYPQTVVFSDYLQSRTGNPGVLGEVAAAIADGRSFEQWLAESVSGRRLGGSLPALEAGWRAWLLREYGAPASTGTQK